MEPERAPDPDVRRAAALFVESISRLLRRTRLAIVQTALRFAPTERQRLFALTVVIGGACGLSAVAFHEAIRLASRFAIDRAFAAHGSTWIPWTLAVPALGGLIAGAALQYVVPNARGSGIPQVKVAYARAGGRLRLRDALGKFFVSSIQIGSGASLGREGPTVQICAGIASTLGRIARISPSNLRRLLPVGAAAGIAAAFNAPIAAVTFTIEEIVGSLDQTVLSGVIVAAALAAVVERTVLGVNPVFEVSQRHGLDGASSLILYAVLGVVSAGVSVLFTESLLRIRARFREVSRVPAWARPAVGGLVTGALALVAAAALHTHGITGGGYDTLATALAGRLSVKVLLALCAMKLVATVFSYGSGGAGGIFAPALFIGGTLGGSIGALDVAIFHHPPENVGAFALVGMGAVFAGIIRAPITSVLIIIEMTGGYSLILPLMVANMSAYALSGQLRPKPIYDALLEQDGIDLRTRAPAESSERPSLRNVELDHRAVVSLTPKMTAGELLEAAAEHGGQQVFPVLDAESRLVGIVTSEDIAALASHGNLDGLVNAADILRPSGAVRSDEDVLTAFESMLAHGVRELPVTDAEGRVLGFVGEVALARALVRARAPKRE